LTREIYGDDVAWVPWQRPGFDLGLVLETVCRDHPNLKGIVLGQHGLINWDNDDKACYELTLRLIEHAAGYIEARDKGEKTFGGMKYATLPEEQRSEILVDVLPWLRGQVSSQNRFIATIQSDNTILRFVNSVDAARLAELGTSCPDHFLRTKIKPLYVDWNSQLEDVDALKVKLTDGLAQYCEDYATYYNTCKRDDSPAMRDSNPTVILIPGIGMIAWGKNKSESRVTAEFYNCAVEVMRGAEAIDEYIALPQQEAFDIGHWKKPSCVGCHLKRNSPDKWPWSLVQAVVLVAIRHCGWLLKVLMWCVPMLILMRQKKRPRRLTKRMVRALVLRARVFHNVGRRLLRT
jgi:rhamnose utilization protein RhaD (predicted bifunctional aldolase and dehydrogenase)